MKLAVLALISIATPAMADQTCVVIHQVGMIRNATSAEIAQGIEVPCYLTDDDAVRWYFRKLHAREDEFCLRCFPNDRPWSRR